MLRLLIKGITKKVAQAGAGRRLARLFCGMMGGKERNMKKLGVLFQKLAEFSQKTPTFFSRNAGNVI